MGVKRAYAPIRAPLSASVVYMPVQNEARVEEGEVVIVLEAMKLSVEIPAPIAGQVEFVVQLHEMVEVDQLIAKIYL